MGNRGYSHALVTATKGSGSKSERVEVMIIEGLKREGEGEQWGAIEGFSAKERCVSSHT